MQKLVASIVCFAVAAVCATALSTTAGGEKAGKLEGTWIATAATSNGKKATEEDLKKVMLTVTFKTGKYSVTVIGKEVEAGTYKTDKSKKPAAIDLTIAEGKEKGKTQLGIYKIEGDVLTIAMTPADSKERPKTFEAADKGEVTVLKRVKQ